MLPSVNWILIRVLATEISSAGTSARKEEPVCPLSTRDVLETGLLDQEALRGNWYPG